MEKSALNAEIRNDNANGGTEASKTKRRDFVAAAIVLTLALCWNAWETAREKAIFERARLEAEAGDPIGMWKLGYCYKNGICCARDERLAFHWFRKGADLNDALLMNCVGLCYDEGWGVAVDKKAVFDWYCKAAELGSAEAAANLGACYLMGEGALMDVGKGLEWTRKAFALGDPTAANNLIYCYQTGYGTPKNLAQAKEYARQERKLQKRRDAEVKRRLETPRPLPGEETATNGEQASE